ncbi:MAG: HAD family hydrolase [Chloroflexota bacterium]|nr:MAG: HAD family hydrolase [Chloroflexota bacterium]
MLPSKLPKAVFLDKDGTLIENVPYNVDPARIVLKVGALEALKQLHAAEFKIIIISNQSGVALGRFKEQDLIAVEECLRQMLASAGIPLDSFYYCPHHPDGRLAQYSTGCFCRKPSPGLLFRAAREHQLNLAASWMIGDILNDVEAGRRADCRTVLIDNGSETDWQISPLRRPHFTAANLLDAAGHILSLEKAAVRPTAAAGSITLDTSVSV